MSTFASGGPSPAIPPARRPLHQGSVFSSPSTGTTNWKMWALGVAVIGGVALAVAYL
jgi:hypothetical protein